MDLRQGAHRALGSLRPSRATCRNTARRRSRRSGGGTRSGRPRRDRARDAIRSGLTRRDALALGAGAGCALVSPPVLPAARRRRTAERHGISGFGDLKYPADFKHFDYVNPNAPEGRRVLADRLDAAVQPELPHLQLAQQLHLQGRRRARHGADLRDADGARRRRAGRHVRACGAGGADFGRRPDLSLPDAAGGEIPRRQPHDGARRGLVARTP